ARAVTLRYGDYTFNLIDTPGHVDFSYEVSRSLAACEGAILVVDATQGVEAQTLANSYLAINNNLDILTVINKVDLPSAEPERVYEVTEMGIYTPKPKAVDSLGVGEVGFFSGNIKDIVQAKIGDTISEEKAQVEALPGFQEVKPMVFAGIFPIITEKYEDLRDAVAKLKLNDASFSYEPESSIALGFGFRCGFLGLLHMEIIQERLEREFNLELLTSAPGVRYRVLKTDGDVLEIDNPQKMPDPAYINSIEEPFLEVTMLTTDEFIGPILALAIDRRGQ